MEDISCPDLAKLEVTSDYGSRENSDMEDICIEGFCSLYSHLGGKGKINPCFILKLTIREGLNTNINQIDGIFHRGTTSPRPLFQGE